MAAEKKSPDISHFEKAIGIKFQDKNLIEEALTHKSYAMENGMNRYNERLEFLGDSILNAAVTEYLFSRYPKEDEGRLSKLKSHLVSRASLVTWSKEMKLGSYLKLSQSEEMTGGRERDSLLANVFEALMGAIFLDQGFGKAREFIITRLAKKKRIVETDYKSRLQEIIQKKYRIPPTYLVTDEVGPDHDKTFIMEVRIKKKAMAQGKGRSKKEAEQQAAYNALRSIRKSQI